ncbi:hypothetical protein AWB91_12425 [Mycobacterium paraense]|uniref:Uncharacterized protein n=1 Tax=Mycobacterium paraense TaxID=767916 RepID=A0ABX3VQ34_9MYCO|nr:hypothetical protein [Mycobacterium paraense]ORW32255.1 hypothetical protein AWB91_12425 [Mycobacterium paraense]ORW35239.1 hypothetical protein AWB88_27135 [Mycobacterium paraense]
MSTRRKRRSAQRDEHGRLVAVKAFPLARDQRGRFTAPKLATGTEHPSAAKRRTRPARTLRAAIGGDERALLMVLRRRLAAPLDAGSVPSHTFAALLRELRSVDARIRALDEASAAAAAAEQDDDDASDDDDGDDTEFDPAKLCSVPRNPGPRLGARPSGPGRVVAPGRWSRELIWGQGHRPPARAARTRRTGARLATRIPVGRRAHFFDVGLVEHQMASERAATTRLTVAPWALVATTAVLVLATVALAVAPLHRSEGAPRRRSAYQSGCVA